MLGTLQDLADRIGGRIIGDGARVIAQISAVEEASTDALTFATDQRYYAAAMASSAAAVLVDAAIAVEAQPPKPLLVVQNARLALAQLLEGLHPPRPRGPMRHASAAIDPTAQLADDVYVGAHAFIGAGARVDRGSAIEASAYVGARTSIGEETWLHPRATVLDECVVGARVVLHAGSVIGSEGFGWAFIDGRLRRIPQVGNVVLEDEVEIGANSCVDRAQTGSTVIGLGTKIDNLVQIGHNCRIGRHCAIAAQCGLAGSTTLGDYVKFGGQAGARGHLRVGSGASVAARSGVWGDVAEGLTVSGHPARDHREELRREVMVRRLPKLVARVEALERERE